ncbi:hypothetical protein [Paenimyroides viscosum]|uniref:Outer membrane protein beta-barrel domain-containing protein n=1 Tax=Paenimyroides viscosum TaxID=2488729 RepID=A0A3P1B5M1_9FLAO|nr:hypothetical protein [Paenimyroides viscosum]RRA96437.1 hypothetical protein EG242_02245 [Paenimyroides viscosum]
MKKIFVLMCVLVSLSSYSQEEKKSNIDFVNTFQFTLGFSNLAPNESMMGDAHSEAFPAIGARLGIFSYNRFTIGLHLNLHRMDVKSNDFFGHFEKTTVFTPGFYLSYYQPITEESLIEPYLSYDNSQYTTKGYGKELNAESDGLGLGLDYQHKIGNRAYVTFGLKYTFNKMRTETHPNWEKYINNYNYMTAKIGFTFSKNRL